MGGNDSMEGGRGTDTIDGGEGDDLVFVLPSEKNGIETYIGGNGFDTLTPGNDQSPFTVDFRQDNISGFERLLFDDPFDGASFPTPTNVVLMRASQIASFTHIEGFSDSSVVEVLGIDLGASTSLDLSGISITKLSGASDRIEIYGDTDAETIIGSSVRDIISAGDGNDTLTGFKGNDSIDGGAGTGDVVRFAGNWSEYTITLSNGVYTVTDTVANRDGVDTVTNVEFFSFNGATGAASALFQAPPTAIADTNSDPVVEQGSRGSDPTATGNVLVNDIQPNTPFEGLVVSAMHTGSFSTTPSAPGTLHGVFGSLTLSANGDYTYTLDNDDPDTADLGTGETDSDVFGYGVTDGSGVTSFATITITITGSNEVGRTVDGTKQGDVIDLKAHKGLRSSKADDDLRGNNGNDKINGSDGDDKIAGGEGRDKLTGGEGSDQFVFANSGTRHADIITDFTSDEDTIGLTGKVFRTLGGMVDEDEFHMVNLHGKKLPTAKDRNDHLFYDKKSGHIYFDDDGSKSHKAVLIATLDKAPPGGLHFDDFVIV